jgi:hypothetical protein
MTQIFSNLFVNQSDNIIVNIMSGLILSSIITTASVASVTDVTDSIYIHTVNSLVSEITWAGIVLPQWVGLFFYICGLAFGATLSTYQETAVDKYIKNPKLKPYYSFGFGIFFTLFGIPLYYDNITIWQLVLPAVCSAAIGSQMIYYFISSAKFIRDAVFLKFGFEPPKDENSELTTINQENFYKE